VISFPVFESLGVSGFDLYPGENDEGIAVEFKPGLTLVLGANGLGKTTLVTLLYRLCAGPYDIPGLSSGGELGNRSVDARQIARSDRRLFAARVVDDAASATASLSMMLGPTNIAVTRSLRMLDLEALSIDGQAVDASEPAYQDAILKHAGLASFGDWILLLRHLVFYFEDRRALVWDPSAQKQILRFLFLPPAKSTEWRAQEREILELDSRMRNLQAALSREQSALAKSEALVGDVDAVKAELGALEELQRIDEPRIANLNDAVASAEGERQAARLRALQAEHAHESAYRDLERRQLMAIEASFPTAGETARYLLARLFSDGECLACGNSAPDAAAELRSRVAAHACIVCGTPLDQATNTKSATTRAINKAAASLAAAEDLLTAASDDLLVTEARFDAMLDELQELNANVSQRRARINALIRQLPPDDLDLHKKQADLAGLLGLVELQKRELVERRATFAAYIRKANRDIVKRREAVKSAFDEFAHGFLLEDCRLVWAPNKARIGESGEQVEFPAFELEMGGASFPSMVRRTGPEQVSESQREFIDLAFRMTLMAVAGATPVGTLVIDAPESSLDAVFVSRAADVLTRFGDPKRGNKLILTSNLIEGNLIPDLIRRAKIRSARDPRVVDLLRLAAPTAATRQLKADYARVRSNLFRRAKSKP
jgi:hypothetical protein